MSDYTQTTDFSAKDALTTGDPEKAISGADVDGELSLISTAIASKRDGTTLGSAGQFLGSTGSADAFYGGPWEMVQRYPATAQATVLVYHDGINNSGANFIDRWEYMVKWNAYNSLDSRYLIGETWEAGTARDDDEAYISCYTGSSSSTPVASETLDNWGLVGGALMGTDADHSSTGWVILTNMASTSYQSEWHGQSFAVVDAGTIGQYSTMARTWDSVTSPSAFLAAEHFRIRGKDLNPVLSGGNITGLFTLFRRYV